MHNKSFHMILNVLLILFSDNEWGLPLAIAANLHFPYHINIGLNHSTEYMDAFDRRK